MTVRSTPKEPTDSNSGMGLALVCPKAFPLQVETGKSDNSLGQLMPVVMPKAFAQNSPEEEAKKILECELYSEFNKALDNKFTFIFIQNYDPKNHGVIEGQVPEFLNLVYKNRLGESLDKKVEDSLVKIEDMLKKGDLSNTEKTQVLSQLDKIVKLSMERYLGNEMLGIPHSGMLDLNPEQLDRLEIISKSIIDNHEIIEFVKTYAIPSYDRDEVFNDEAIAKELHEILGSLTLIRHEKEQGPASNSLLEISRSIAKIREDIFSDYIMRVGDLCKEAKNSALEKVTDENIKTEVRTASDRLSIAAEVIPYCKYLLANEYSYQADQIFEGTIKAVLPKGLFRNDLDVNKYINLIQAAKAESEEPLNSFNNLLGNSGVLKEAQRVKGVDALIDSYIRDEYGKALLKLPTAQEEIIGDHFEGIKAALEKLSLKNESFYKLLSEWNNSESPKEMNYSDTDRLRVLISDYQIKFAESAILNFKADPNLKEEEVRVNLNKQLDELGKFAMDLLPKEFQQSIEREKNKAKYLFNGKLEAYKAGELILEEYLQFGSKADPNKIVSIIKNALDSIDGNNQLEGKENVGLREVIQEDFSSKLDSNILNLQTLASLGKEINVAEVRSLIQYLIDLRSPYNFSEPEFNRITSDLFSKISRKEEKDSVVDLRQTFRENLDSVKLQLSSNTLDSKLMKDIRCMLMLGSIDPSTSHEIESVAKSLYSETIQNNTQNIFKDEMFWAKGVTEFSAAIASAKEESSKQLAQFEELFVGETFHKQGQTVLKVDAELNLLLESKYSESISLLINDLRNGEPIKLSEYIRQFEGREAYLDSLAKTLQPTSTDNFRATYHQEKKELLLQEISLNLESSLNEYISKTDADINVSAEKHRTFEQMIYTALEMLKFAPKEELVSLVNEAKQAQLQLSLTKVESDLLEHFGGNYNSFWKSIEGEYLEKSSRWKTFAEALVPPSDLSKIEDFRGNSIQHFTSRLGALVAAEEVLGEYLEHGEKANPQIVLNIFNNCVDLNSMWSEKDIRSNLVSEYLGKLKTAVENGEQLKLSDLRDFIFSLSSYGMQRESYNPAGFRLIKQVDLFPERILPLIDEKITNLNNKELSDEQKKALIVLFSNSTFNRIDFEMLAKSKEDLNSQANLSLLERSLLGILKIDSILSTQTNLVEHQAVVPLVEARLDAIASMRNRDRGRNLDELIGVEERMKAARSFLSQLEVIEGDSELFKNFQNTPLMQPEFNKNEVSRYSFGLLNSFPSLEQLEQGNLGKYDEIQAMNLLFKNSATDVGSMARQWLEACYAEGEEKGELAEKVLSELLYKTSDKDSLYEQLRLPRFLNPENKNGMDLSEAEKKKILEFIIGFAGSKKGEHRGQLEKFHLLTRDAYKMNDAFSFERIEPLLKEARERGF